MNMRVCKQRTKVVDKEREEDSRRQCTVEKGKRVFVLAAFV